jgi:flagellar biosynthesis/type III secretory pathway protein FliH
MSIADKIFALGAEEGEARGVEKGVKRGLKSGIEKGIEKGQLIGKVQLYEEWLGLTPSPAELLREKTERVLRKRLSELEARFRRR